MIFNDISSAKSCVPKVSLNLANERTILLHRIRYVQSRERMVDFGNSHSFYPSFLTLKLNGKRHCVCFCAQCMPERLGVSKPFHIGVQGDSRC